MPTITICGETFEVSPPKSFAQREDIATHWSKAAASDAIARRVFGMSVGYCAPQALQLPHPDEVDLSYSGNVLSYGRVCYDSLRSRGCSTEEIIAAARACFNATMKSLFPRQVEVSAAEDFSETGDGPTA